MDPPPSTTTTTTGDTFPTPKLRLMCSYGGHIIPRPTDKNLCYAGGETRIVAVDRRTSFSLSSLTTHLSKSLQNAPNPLSLKYQLPNHDLDSLISITTDEDLSNMIDEYDRLISSSSNSRLRFFIFPTTTTADLNDPTSENWFIDALKNAGVVNKGGRSSESNDEQEEGDGKIGGSGNSLPESIVMEKNSSFGSTSSSVSNSNSSAIRSGGDESVGVRMGDAKMMGLPTVDSIGSDSSIASPNFSSQAIVYRDASGILESKAVYSMPHETETNASEHSTHSDLLTPVHVHGYVVTKPVDHQLQQAAPPASLSPSQPHYIYSSSQSHYVPPYYTNPMPIAPYPPMYQPFVQPQPVQYQMNKPYPIYVMPVGHPQNPYDVPMQYMSTTTQNAVPDPQIPSNPVMVSPIPCEGYNPVAAPPPEYAAKLYGTPSVVTPPVNNVPSNDQVDAFPHVNLSSQAIVASSENTNDVGDYEDPMHHQIYKTQPSGPPILPSPI